MADGFLGGVQVPVVPVPRPPGPSENRFDTLWASIFGFVSEDGSFKPGLSQSVVVLTGRLDLLDKRLDSIERLGGKALWLLGAIAMFTGLSATHNYSVWDVFGTVAKHLLGG